MHLFINSKKLKCICKVSHQYLTLAAENSVYGFESIAKFYGSIVDSSYPDVV